MSRAGSRVKSALKGLSKTEKNILLGAVVLGAVFGLILLSRKSAATGAITSPCRDGSCLS